MFLPGCIVLNSILLAASHLHAATVAEVLGKSTAADWRPLDPENTLYLDLSNGRVVIALAPEFAPKHVANVKALAREKYFDGLAILRVQDNFVIQWGDPDAEKPERARKIEGARRTLPPEFDRPIDTSIPFTRLPDGDVYAPEVGFSNGFPVARDPQSGRMWLTHAYGMVGAGRDEKIDSGDGTELYAVIGQAPRQLDRNVTLLGRVLQGMELLSALPRGTGALGFYQRPEQRTPIRGVRVAADVPASDRIALEVLRTDTPLFVELVESRRNRREAWYHWVAGRIELANVPLPVREITRTNRPVVLELWPGAVPDETQRIGPERERLSPKLDRSQVEVTEQTRLITDVSRPTISIYSPPAEKRTGTAVLICPGGGYWDLYWQLEGEEVAQWLNSIGATGVILKYRVPRRADEPKGEPARRPLQDAQRAIRLLRARAGEWQIDPARIGIIGFSAGGHLAIASATEFEKRTYASIDSTDEISPRPDFAIALYSGYLKAKDAPELSAAIHVPANAPPVFLVHGGKDLISPPEGSVLTYLALKRAGVPAELHIYGTATHDFGVRQTDQPYSAWTASCQRWLEELKLLDRH